VRLNITKTIAVWTRPPKLGKGVVRRGGIALLLHFG
jgi:hypothetical protein